MPSTSPSRLKPRRKSGGMIKRKSPTLLLVLVSLMGAAIFWASTSSSSPATRVFSTKNYSATGQASVYVPINGEKTNYVNGIAGTTLWENIYLRNGTWYVVTSHPQSMPEVGTILCAEPLPERKHIPAGPDRFQYINPSQASEILGKVAVRKAGLSMFFNDEPGPNGQSFLAHYFHSEVFLSAWRLVTSSYGTVPLPERLMYRTVPEDWRDKAGLTTWFQQSVMPNTIIEDAPVWKDRKASQTTFVFDRLVIVDRFSAHMFGHDVGLWNKMTADLPTLPVPKDWMLPLRNSLKNFVLAQGCELEREHARVPILTYVNRQMTSRRLEAEDADLLLESLNQLHAKGEVEFHNAIMENMDRADQFCLALKSDILIGVHGNGLSHQLWMKPGSAVLEDYALPADLMGHEYYAIHNDTYLPRSEWILSDGRAMQQGKGFHSSNIRTHGPYIASLISRLAKDRSSPVDKSSL
ncbi:hypothetical protein BCR39DRAFT_512977 [Naematelia encephala]|uniref:Glycosyltransferase 61 catalytic domain-containing protein n=1 Tax=Naematelia encephala TaxID=71784 RepID=A0A1Y2BP27_9TREE|nr:hypothetical protein BCR39DRAFT_512977 [Naematelia encephala]